MTALPAIGKPATRALLAAGYPSIEDLAGVSARDLLALHGVGPRAIVLLNEELTRLGLDVLDDAVEDESAALDAARAPGPVE